MSAVRRALPLLLALLVGACAPRGGGAPAPSPAPDTLRGGVTLSVPPSAGAFTFLERREVRGAPNDVQLRYSDADDILADVFIYAGPDLATACPLDCARTIIDREVELFQQGFGEMISRGYVEKIATTSDVPLTPPAGAVWRLGRHLTLDVRRDGTDQRSDFYLFYLPGARVKVRATYPATVRPARIESFVNELVPQLVGGAPKSP